jgi:membrane protease YdiL (CAAX protease family)
MAVIWIPRQFMMWRFGITFEKIPILYLIVTQIVLVEGLMLTEFGLHRKKLLKNILLGCLIAFIYVSIMTVFNVLIPVILNGAGVLSNLEIFEISQFITFPWQLIAVGISEELFFRGYFFTKLRKSGATFWYSAILTSFVFMIFHIPWLIRPDFSVNLYIPYVIYRVINTFPLGLVFCALYEKTRSLTASIVFHGFYNSLTTLLLVNIAPTFLFELIIWIITFFNLLFLLVLTPHLSKLFGFDKNNKIS